MASPQQKCYAHHLRAVSAERANAYAEHWHALLRVAIALKHTGTPAARDDPRRRAREIAADEWLATPRTDNLEEALQRRLRNQRNHLFTVLDHADVPATNISVMPRAA